MITGRIRQQLLEHLDANPGTISDLSGLLRKIIKLMPLAPLAPKTKKSVNPKK